MLPSSSHSSKGYAYIIIPVHNRRAHTLKCLQKLYDSDASAHFSVIVVDDGSIDGTSEAIKANYPNVILLLGNGQLWWTGAIELGMKYAYEKGAEYILWLNNDTFPYEGTIEKLLSYCQNNINTIAASQCHFKEKFTYGGQNRAHLFQLPVHAKENEIAVCDALDGNLVCFPRSVIKDVGYPPSKYIPHYGGDNLYTWSLKKLGYQLCLLGDAKSICEQDHPQVSWILDPAPIWKPWHATTSPKNKHYIPGHWYFCLHYWGILGIIPFLRPYIRLFAFTLLRLLVPSPWLIFLKQRYKAV